MVDEGAHEGVDIVVVGRGRQHQAVIAEGVFHSLSHIVAGQVSDDDLGAAFLFQKSGELFHSLFCVAVDGGVGDQDALILRGVGGPLVIEIDIITQILGEDRAVQRADDLDIQCRGFLEQVLGLQAVFADNAEIIAARFACPVFLLDIEGSEFAEAVRGEEDLVRAVIGDHDFRPVDHGSKDEIQYMRAQLELVAVLDDQLLHGGIKVKELSHEGKGLGVSDYSRVGIDIEEIEDICGVVRLHMLHDQVIGLTAAQDFAELSEPLICKFYIHGIHDGDLLVHDDVGIVGHAVGDYILALKQIDDMIVDTDVLDRICDLHIWSSPFLWNTVKALQIQEFVCGGDRGQPQYRRCIARPQVLFYCSWLRHRQHRAFPRSFCAWRRKVSCHGV